MLRDFLKLSKAWSMKNLRRKELRYNHLFQV